MLRIPRTHQAITGAVVYLDLLGFKKSVRKDLRGAIGLLADCNHILETAVTDDRLHPVSSYPAELREIARRTLVTSFDQYLPMSDSIFIVSSNPSLLVLQLAHFLKACLTFRVNAFDGRADKKDPRRVIVTDLASGSKDAEMWFPVLLRGGIASGSVLPLRMSAIVDRRCRKARNLAGQAVIDAVALDKNAIKGPRVICGHLFTRQLSTDAVRYVQPCMDNEDLQELYWPLAYFETCNTVDDGLPNGLGEPLRAAVRLWNWAKRAKLAVPPEKAIRPEQQREIAKLRVTSTIRCADLRQVVARSGVVCRTSTAWACGTGVR